MRKIRNLVLLATLVMVCFSGTQGDTTTRKSERVCGNWTLVSASAWSKEGVKLDHPFGPNPKGLLIYTREGRMAVMISHSGRKKLSGDRIESPVQEKAEAFELFSRTQDVIP